MPVGLHNNANDSQIPYRVSTGAPMIFLISDVLGTGELNALSDAAQALEFSDGKLTAGASAAQVKSNLQAVASPALKAIKTMVERRLLDHPLIQSAALPEAVVRLTLSRY